MLHLLTDEELCYIDGGKDLTKVGAWFHRAWNKVNEFLEKLADEYVEEYGGVFQNCD